MWSTRLLISTVASLVVLVSGCMGLHEQQADQPRTMYSSLDATALVYSDPNAAAPSDDYPLRWAGFLLHPVGLGIDYGFNRPARALASKSPGFFGYTAEDSQLDSERSSLGRRPTEEVD